MELSFDGEVIHWRGPSPFHFVAVPEDESAQIRDVSQMVTYAWGVVPVRATIGGTQWTTSLFPKHGRYLVPVKDVVRRGEHLGVGDVVTVRLLLDV